MKNKLIIMILLILLNLSISKLVTAEEFIFKVTDLEILENNTIFKGNNRGKIITDTQVELISDNFATLKKVMCLRQMVMFYLMILKII